MGKSRDSRNEKVRRFESAVHELIREGHSLFDYRGLLEKAAQLRGGLRGRSRGVRVRVTPNDRSIV